MSGKIFALELFSKTFLANRRLQDPVKCNICKKHGGTKLIFCLQINITISYQLMPLYLSGVAKLAQSTQNNKFVISL